MTGDVAEFTVALVDKITGPSERIAASLLEVSKTLLETQEALKKLSHTPAPTIVKPGMLAKLSSGLQGVVSKLESAVFWTLKWGLAAAGGAVVGIATMVTRGVVGMGIFADATRRAFASLAGGEAKGALAFERVRKTAELLGEDVAQTADQFKGLMAMQFSVGEAEEMIKISADLKAVTGHAEATQRAITAITQIKAKGRLQSEELVGQLAEAGVSTTLVYDQLAKKLGKTGAEIRAMISAGKIDADTGIWAIKEAIKTKVHEKSPGEAAVAFSEKTLSGLLQRLGNLPNTLFLEVADHLTDSFEESKDVIRGIIGDLKTIDTKKIAGFIANVLKTLKQIIPLVKEFVGGFMDAFSIEFDLGGPEDMAGNMVKARDAGEALAKALKLAYDFATEIAKGLVWLTGDSAKWVRWLLLGLYALIKISGWVTAIRAGMVALGAVSGGAGAAGGGAAAGGWLMPLMGALISLPGLAAAAGVALAALSWTYREELGSMYLDAWDWLTGGPERAKDDDGTGIGRQAGRGMGSSKDVRQWKKPPSEDPFYAGPTAPLGMYQPPPGTGTAPLPTPQPAIVPPPAQNFSSNIVVNMSVAETQGKTPNELGQTVADKVLDVQSSFYENQNASYGGLMSSPEGP